MSLIKIILNTNFSSQNLIDPRKESYTKTAKRYLDHIISIIASYAPLIALGTTLLYAIPELEAHAIITDSPIITTIPKSDQVDVRPVRFLTKLPFPHQIGSYTIRRSIHIYIYHNLIQNYQIRDIANECLATSKTSINNIANRVIKCAPVMTALMTLEALFFLIHQAEGRYILGDSTTTIELATELDDVEIVNLNNLYDTLLCGTFSSIC